MDLKTDKNDMIELSAKGSPVAAGNSTEIQQQVTIEEKPIIPYGTSAYIAAARRKAKKSKFASMKESFSAWLNGHTELINQSTAHRNKKKPPKSKWQQNNKNRRKSSSTVTKKKFYHRFKIFKNKQGQKSRRKKKTKFFHGESLLKARRIYLNLSVVRKHSGSISTDIIDMSGTAVPSDLEQNVQPADAASGTKLSFYLERFLLDPHSVIAGPSFPSNRISTAKYSIYNFLFKNLFEQFRRVANFYFLSLIIIQSIPIFEQVSPLLAAAPVITIVAITGIKDIFEDYKRHKSDNQVNASHVFVLNHWENLNFVNTISTASASSLYSFKQKILLRLVSLKNKFKSFLVKENENSQRCDKDSDWIVKPWESLRVGDIIKIKNNDIIPADILIISTSEQENICYVETKNLDGETNLKVRKGPMETFHAQTPNEIRNLKLIMEAEIPNVNLYSFNGRLIIERKVQRFFCNFEYTEEVPIPSDPLSNERVDIFTSDLPTPTSPSKYHHRQQHSRGESLSASLPPHLVPIGANSLLLRGCVLKNTQFVVGLVVYTGIETKIMLNSGITPSKRSRIERQMNPQIVLNFVFLFIICSVCAIVQADISGDLISLKNAPFSYESFVPNSNSPAFNGFIVFWSCLLLFQTLVPISLYITVEVVKTVQAYLIFVDEEMYYEKTKQSCVPRAWNLSDDLGQIEYVFSDKTGTLTQNVMEFRQCSIGGNIYGSFNNNTNNNTPESNSPRKNEGTRNNTTPNELDKMKQEMKSILNNNSNKNNNNSKSDVQHSFIDSKLFIDIREHPLKSEQIRLFFTILSLCHTVLVHKDENTNNTQQQQQPLQAVASEIIYKAQSPDEAALVNTARNLGFVFLERSNETITVDILGNIQSWTILHVIEFNSSRKRMSVILKREDGQIFLFAKGADSVIYERLKNSGTPLEKNTLSHLDKFAENGLRTLCIAQKKIPLATYEKWSKKYAEASGAIKNRESLMDAAANEIEQELSLVGATAIEDKLQEGVPETIELLQRAGLKIWVLTGDKVETAVNIAFSCNLLSKEMLVIVVKGIDGPETARQLSDAAEQIITSFDEDSSDEGKDEKGLNMSSFSSYALVVDGNSLKFALDPELRESFLDLATRCKVVLCCRVSPLQKAQVVELVRFGRNAMTLSIGDGANDVSMIQSADVGIGISGEEGLQAVMASDYSISQFRFLSRLLLVHGRLSYLKVAQVTLCSFYKNVVFVIVLFWYQFYCSFTAQFIYDYMFTMFYNLFFSVFPILTLGWFDRDMHNVSASMRLPQLYTYGIEQKAYSMKYFLLYVLNALYQSVIAYFMPYLGFLDVAIDSSGRSEDFKMLGTIMAFSVIISVNLFFIMKTMSLNMYSILAFVGSHVFFVFLCFLYNFIPDQNLHRVFTEVWGSARFYFTIAITVLTCFLPTFLYLAFKVSMRPSDSDIVREVFKYGKASDLNQLYASALINGNSSVATARKSKQSLPFPNNNNPNNESEIGLSTSQQHSAIIHGLQVPKPLHVKAENSLSNSKNLVFYPQPLPISLSQSASQIDLHADAPLVKPLKKKMKKLLFLNMKTGAFERIRGFAFSHGEGMRDIVEGKTQQNHQQPQQQTKLQTTFNYAKEQQSSNSAVIKPFGAGASIVENILPFSRSTSSVKASSTLSTTHQKNPKRGLPVVINNNNNNK